MGADSSRVAGTGRVHALSWCDGRNWQCESASPLKQYASSSSVKKGDDNQLRIDMGNRCWRFEKGRGTERVTDTNEVGIIWYDCQAALKAPLKFMIRTLKYNYSEVVYSPATSRCMGTSKVGVKLARASWEEVRSATKNTLKPWTLLPLFPCHPLTPPPPA